MVEEEEEVASDLNGGDGGSSSEGDQVAELDMTDEEEESDATKRVEQVENQISETLVKSSGQQAEEKKLVRLRRDYVETSLDDLSYSSSSSSESSSGQRKSPKEREKLAAERNIAPESLLMSDKSQPSIDTGSRQSADEEVERRLLAHLQNKQQQQQQRDQLERVQRMQQEDLARQQQQAQLQQQTLINERRGQSQPAASCCRPTGGRVLGSEGEEDELPPEVPVRRSSQAAMRAPGRPQPPQSIRGPPPAAAGHFDVSQLPRPLLARPTQPPPPPPAPQVTGTGSASRIPLRVKRQRRAESPQFRIEAAQFRAAPPPPPPPPPSRSRSQPPRNIWSPSSSSLSSAANMAPDDSTSGDCCAPDDDDDSVASCPGLGLEERPAGGGVAASPTDTPSLQSTIIELRGRQRETDVRQPPAEVNFASFNGQLGEASVTQQQQAISSNKTNAAQLLPKQQQKFYGPESSEQLAAGSNSANEDINRAQGKQTKALVGNNDDATDDHETRESNKLMGRCQSLARGDEQQPEVDSLAQPKGLSGEQEKLEAPPNNNNNGNNKSWRSYSVSLHQLGNKSTSHQQPPSQAQAAAQSPEQQAPRAEAARSYSIATSTLTGSEEPKTRAKHKSPAEGEQVERYWTLPNEVRVAKQLVGSEAAVACRANEEPLRRQQQPQQLNRSSFSSATRCNNNNAASISRQSADSIEHNNNITAASLRDEDTNSSNNMEQLAQSRENNSKESLPISAKHRKVIEMETHRRLEVYEQQQTQYQRRPRDKEADRDADAEGESGHSEIPESPAHYSSQPPPLANQQRGQQVKATPGGGGLRDEWFRQMYKQMHRQMNKQSPVNRMLQAVNSAQQHDDCATSGQQQNINRQLKLKPLKDDIQSSSFCSEDEEFKQFEGLCGQSQLSVHERNLELYHKLIDHIDRVFSSVLPEVTSRSTNTLQVRHKRRTKRQSQAKSRSGPQSPVSTLNKLQRHQYHQHINRPTAEHDIYRAINVNNTNNNEADHERRCVFSQLLRESDQQQQQDTYRQLLLNSNLDLEQDPRKQYVAVQQGHDIPLKGLRKPAPQPNLYKDLSLSKRTEPNPWDIQASNSLRSTRTSNNNFTWLQQQPPEITVTQPPRSSSVGASELRGNRLNDSRWLDELYRDFDSIYQSMASEEPTAVAMISTGGSSNRADPAATSACESSQLQLDRSMVEVEEALRRVQLAAAPATPALTTMSQVSPTGSSTYGQLITATTNNERPSPSSAVGGESQRADSRNTNQSFQLGPALVEEMTLSDLEEEISFSLMAAKEQASSLKRQQRQQQQLLLNNNINRPQICSLEAGEHLLRGRRNRNPLPASLSSNTSSSSRGYLAGSFDSNMTATIHAAQDQMFSDDFINIHYKAPTSKLLKMNTLNEFELNRIKKLYSANMGCSEHQSRDGNQHCDSYQLLQPLRTDGPGAGHLHRSKSSRLPVGDCNEWYLPPATSGHYAANRQQQQARSADRLHSCCQRESPAGGQQQRAESPFIDLHRYQRAFLTKSPKLAAGHQQAGLREAARFGRALFDFQAKGEGELSLRRGDLIELLETIDHSWARVEDCQSGLQGLVPLNYVDCGVGCAVARRDVRCEGQEPRPTTAATAPLAAGNVPLLPMSKGEPITLIRRLSGHWYEASNTRQATGLVWSNDLDIIKQPALRRELELSSPPASRPLNSRAAECKLPEDSYLNYRELEEEEDGEEEMLILDSGERVLARRRAQSASGGYLQRRRSARHKNREPPAPDHAHCCASGRAPAAGGGHYQAEEQLYAGQAPRRSSSSPYISAGLSQVQQPAQVRPPVQPRPGSRPAQPQRADLPRLCRAKYPYKSRQKDELDLEVGQILMVVHECDDGWFIGSSYSTNQSGTFPGNFVEPL